MIISLTLGIVLAVLAGLAVAALIYFLLRKIKAGQKAGVITGLIIGMLAGVAVVMMAGRIVVVKSIDDAGEYLVYGTPSYEFSNGVTMDLDMGANEGYILNDSDMEIVLEKVVYSVSPLYKDASDVLIHPLSITQMPSFKIHYYFDDTPPMEMDIPSGQNSVTKYHLRTKESYENEYGPYYYDPTVVSVPVGTPSHTASDSEEEEEEDVEEDVEEGDE